MIPKRVIKGSIVIYKIHNSWIYQFNLIYHVTMYHYANVHKISMSLSILIGLQAINQYMQECIISLSLLISLLSNHLSMHAKLHNFNKTSQINMEPTCRAMATSSHARYSKLPFLPPRKIIGAQKKYIYNKRTQKGGKIH